VFEGKPVHPPAVPPKRDLPERLLPIRLSTRAANLLYSVIYDAALIGAQDVKKIEENYGHLNQSKADLVEYIARLEQQLKIPQQEFVKFF
jgi:hypothetical protein